DAALVPDDVHVAAVIDEARPGRDDVRGAGRVVAQVERRGAGLDDDEAGPGVAMPAEGPARRDPNLENLEIRGSLRVDPGLPEVCPGVGIDVGFRLGIDVTEAPLCKGRH